MKTEKTNNPTAEPKYQTLVFTDQHEGPYLDQFPAPFGGDWKCVGWSASSCMLERDEAYRVLAKIAIGSLGYGDAEDVARQFFKDNNEEPYSYYDPDKEEEEDEDEDSEEETP
jgi:hypothetical protein